MKTHASKAGGLQPRNRKEERAMTHLIMEGERAYDELYKKKKKPSISTYIFLAVMLGLIITLIIL